jgi:hypothetical protein
VNGEHETNWAAEECATVRLGDTRLDARLITLCDRISDAPESPINQACADWAETQAAYRFFQNEPVEVGEILGPTDARRPSAPSRTRQSSRFRIPATSSTPATPRRRDSAQYP